MRSAEIRSQGAVVGRSNQHTRSLYLAIQADHCQPKNSHHRQYYTVLMSEGYRTGPALSAASLSKAVVVSSKRMASQPPTLRTCFSSKIASITMRTIRTRGVIAASTTTQQLSDSYTKGEERREKREKEGDKMQLY